MVIEWGTGSATNTKWFVRMRDRNTIIPNRLRHIEKAKSKRKRRDKLNAFLIEYKIAGIDLTNWHSRIAKIERSLL
jgi:hypothetical protein